MALRFLIVYLILAGILQAYFIYELYSYIETFSELYPVSTKEHLVLHDLIINIVVSMSLTTVFGAFSIIAVSILYSHKIAGPIYVIKQNLDKLINSEYDIRTNFRDGDEFSEISHKINQLAKKLQNDK